MRSLAVVSGWSKTSTSARWRTALRNTRRG
jgi:hypothetical protein